MPDTTGSAALWITSSLGQVPESPAGRGPGRTGEDRQLVRHRGASAWAISRGQGEGDRISGCAASVACSSPCCGGASREGMAVQPASTPLPPNVHVVHEVLCGEGPQTGRALERLLAKRGVVVPVDRLLELPGRFPSAFMIDEAGRLAVPPACDRCGAHQGEAGQRDVGAAPCAACGRAVCRDCRGDGAGLQALCAECAAPRRLPEADLRYCRAWVLGGERRLLVGERSAMLLG